MELYLRIVKCNFLEKSEIIIQWNHHVLVSVLVVYFVPSWLSFLFVYVPVFSLVRLKNLCFFVFSVFNSEPNLWSSIGFESWHFYLLRDAALMPFETNNVCCVLCEPFSVGDCLYAGTESATVLLWRKVSRDTTSCRLWNQYWPM